jgi:hypothetical protein
MTYNPCIPSGDLQLRTLGLRSREVCTDCRRRRVTDFALCADTLCERCHYVRHRSPRDPLLCNKCDLGPETERRRTAEVSAATKAAIKRASHTLTAPDEAHIWLAGQTAAHLFADGEYESYCGGNSVRVVVRVSERQPAWAGMPRCIVCGDVYLRSLRRRA